ncbi:MAG: hypothetical protein ATN35_09380 [Epulopiscium sp. Nele67-Bin004]|nr:MAG: hypothetical protein ATN35_09380 [Epulopiscium sp. Nele67-Bin004]
MRLGRGLDVLFSPDTHEEQARLKEERTELSILLPIEKIDPKEGQPRKQFAQGPLDELTESIKQHGVLQPITVVQEGDRYEIIAGERRYRAARNAGLTKMPATITTISKQQQLEIALVENIQREDLNTIELAKAYQLLVEEFGLTQDQIASKVGKSRSAVANTIRLNQLSEYAQEKIIDNEITFGHAKAILSLEGEQQQNEVVDIVIEKELTVRQLEQYIQSLNKEETPKETIQKAEQSVFHKQIEEKLQVILGTKVTLSTGKKKNKIEIEYYSDEELARIIDTFKTT